MTPLTDGTARDGAGFDLDLGTENGIIQYNWSHDNQGEGYLFVSWPVGYGYSRGVSHNAQMRYNLSERDGKKLAGGISVFGGVSPLVIYNNTIYYEPDRPAGTPMFNGEGGALTTSIWGKSGKPDLRAYNNIFVTNGKTNTAAVSNDVWSDGSGTFTFDNNIWWLVEGGVQFQWGNTAIVSWSGWQTSGFDPSGKNADALFVGRIGSGPRAYFLANGSPAIDSSRVVTDALRGMGLQDASGATIPQGSAYNIGACEHRVVWPDPAAPRMTGLNRQTSGSWQVVLSGLSGRSYGVEGSTDFKAWSRVGTALEISSGQFRATDAGATPVRVYRAVARGMPGL